MAFADEFKEGLAELEDLFSEVFTWPKVGMDGSTDYPCFAKGAIKGGKLEEFGYNINRDITITLRSELFPINRPERGQQFSCRGASTGFPPTQDRADRPQRPSPG